jgi:hypothetical protein
MDNINNLISKENNKGLFIGVERADKNKELSFVNFNTIKKSNNFIIVAETGRGMSFSNKKQLFDTINQNSNKIIKGEKANV